jgi:nucleoside-diphosphate-sugar epimerase
MNILITGGAGFLGTKLCAALLRRGQLTDAQGMTREIERIRLFDVIARLHDDPRVECVTGDIASHADVAAALSGDTDSVFHLAAVVSGEAEQNFDLGMRVNVDGARSVFEACHALSLSKGRPPKVVFTSSLAVFGGPLPEPVPDDQALTPQNSYGAQKAIGELLLNDMSRKGFIDGRALRLPTISVRPGKPNKAASGFLSGIIREPLNGIEAICPVEPSLRAWLLSPRRAVENLILAHELPASAFGHTRSINVPGLTVSVGQMMQALRDVAGDDVANRVRFERDPFIEKLMLGWPPAFEAAFGKSLGMQADPDYASIIQAYIEDELGQ